MFKYTGNIEKIKDAVEMANYKTLCADIVEDVKDSVDYDMSNVNTEYLSAEILMRFDADIMNVEIYYPRYRYSSAMGYYSKSKPNTIHINGYKINSIHIYELVSLLWHEFCHYVDYKLPDGYYANHGSNSSKGKAYTFQYSVNRYVYSYFDYKKETNTYYIPWYKKVLRWFK
tara:strand:+ start:181 stop:696 length:516 start_codon:yes stop_codon:yes gene_type:complete